MSVVVIGADYLGGIEKNLYELGVKELIHINGRKAGNQSKLNIPKDARFILVFTDYVNHNTAKMIKNMAKTQDIPLVFSKRSWGALEGKLMSSGVLH